MFIAPRNEEIPRSVGAQCMSLLWISFLINNDFPFYEYFVPTGLTHQTTSEDQHKSPARCRESP
jgi:hypothetical protein